MPRLKCPRCARPVEIAPGAPRVCPYCGFGSGGSGATRPVAGSAPPTGQAGYVAAPYDEPTGGPAQTSGSPAGGAAGAIGRIVAWYAVIGLALGIAVLSAGAAFGLFSEEPSDFGDALLGGLFLINGLSFTFFGGIILAAVAGLYALRAVAGRMQAALVGAAGAAVGHLALSLVFIVVVVSGIMVFSPDDESDEMGQQDDTPADFGLILQFLVGVVPAAIVGGVTPLLLDGRAAQDVPRRSH